MDSTCFLLSEARLSGQKEKVIEEKIPGDLVHFSYRHESGGRSGHILKDVFTSVILAEIIGGAVVANSTWARQELISSSGMREVLLRKREDYRYIYSFKPNRKHWGGISYHDLVQFKKWVETLLEPRTCILVEIGGVFRIHLNQVSNWEREGQIQSGTFSKLIGSLRSMYWGRETRPRFAWPPLRAAIHARRGDVAYPAHRQYQTMGPGGVWHAGFYQRCIDRIRAEFPQCQISLYSENIGSEDLACLKGALLELGGKKELRSHIREMVTADLFVPASSSLSTWISYLREGPVWVYHVRHIKHFSHHALPKWFRLCDVDMSNL